MQATSAFDVRQGRAHDLDAAKRRLDALATLLDSAVRVPGTSVTVGADALLNLIPGVGTAAAKLAAAYIVWEARRLGVPTTTLVRMVGNVGLDFVISAIPVVGWFGDVFFRANRRNMDLVRAHIERQGGGGRHGARAFDLPPGAWRRT